MTLLLGIDHGGTRTKLLLVDETTSGRGVVRQDSVDTAGSAGSLEDLSRAVERFVDGLPVAAFGLTVAGIVDESTGIVRASANMPWLDGSSPAAAIGAALDAPGVAVNDGGATARAEAVLGAGRSCDDVFVIALGTGIAGAHVVAGAVRHGAHGGAGEVGHVPLGGRRLCSCGQRGCLETEIGGLRLAARWIRSGRGAAGDTARELVGAAADGDAVARGILDEATSALARTLLGVIAIVDPGVIVIGGGLSAAESWIVAPAVAKVRGGATFHRVPPIVPARFGVWAGAWGAVLAAGERAALRV